MSATKDYVNKKWIDWLLATIISILAIFTSMKTEVFGKFATREYVDNKAYNIKIEQNMVNSAISKDIENVRREQKIQYDAILETLREIKTDVREIRKNK
jgi:hypothetical protein